MIKSFEPFVKRLANIDIDIEITLTGNYPCHWVYLNEVNGNKIKEIF